MPSCAAGRAGRLGAVVRRVIERWERDDEGDWVAELSCLHRQHVRHRPPFRSAPWVADDRQREARLGSELDCPLCDRAEVPVDLVVARTTDTWDETTLPVGLRRSHRIGAHRWGLIRVEDGRLRFRAATSPPLDRVLCAGDEQPIPPEVDHDVTPDGPVRFHVVFLRR